VFLYPKSKHARTLSPRVFKNYGTYKRYLQTEFLRLCVYCREPDCTGRSLIYTVDHYRPKSIPRFASLLCSYDNLFYCCFSCNTRKTIYWPLDEKVGPYVVNPCDYEMPKHLRFNSTTGEVESRTAHGKHTEELLQLNEPSSVQFRLTLLRTISLYRSSIEKIRLAIDMVEHQFQSGHMSLGERDAEVGNLTAELKADIISLESYTGELPLPPLRKVRFGIVL
jgi:5-methylcytosine-specific restriction endonuclease McrA